MGDISVRVEFPMELLIIPAMSGVFFNDVLAILSLAGCTMMFLAALSPRRWARLERIGEWAIAPLVFGTFFQLSLLIVNVDPEKIGVVLPMSVGLVTWMFALSLVLFAAWGWMRRKDL